jgi:hypothetical protein
LTPRLLKILVVSYAVKTALVGAAWLVMPDLPQRAASTARAAWTWVVGAEEGRGASAD